MSKKPKFVLDISYPDNMTIWKPCYKTIHGAILYVNQYGGVKTRRRDGSINYPLVYTMNTSPSTKAHGRKKPKLYQRICNQYEKLFLFIHRLVASVFCHARDIFCTQVDHLDGDPTNNRADNLEWVTGSENVQRRFALERFKKEHPDEWERQQFINQNKFHYYAKD